MMASSDEQQVSSLTPAVCVTDWTLCALCQKNTRERLQCPANNSNKTALGASYKTLAQHLLKFEELGSKMPMSVNMARLDEGGGVENTFLKRSAVFHSSCRLKFNKTELKRRAASVDSKSEKIATAAESVDKKIPSPTPSKLLRRHSDEHDTESEPICFLCAQKAPLAKLRNASTFKLDAKLRHCAAVLQDHNLQAKLSSDWGWQNPLGQWEPYWTHLPEAALACRELIKCACLKGCKTRCGCIREGLKCTALCTCSCSSLTNGRSAAVQ